MIELEDMVETQAESGEREDRFRAVGEYYEDRAVRCWEITSRGHLHTGYWDETNASGEPWAGPRRLTELMIEWTEIGKGQRFIDFGSGLGWPAIELARSIGCIVDGVNASRYQVESAIEAAEAEGLSDRVRFHLRDAVDVPFEEGTFDGGWFFESIFHMGHLDALREAHRVLKPGAQLLITDFVNLEHTTQEFIDLQHEILLAHHPTAAEYPDMLSATGFELVELTDLTEQTVIKSDQKNREAFELYKEELLTTVDAEYLSFVRSVSDSFAENSGYIIVKARNRK